MNRPGDTIGEGELPDDVQRIKRDNDWLRTRLKALADDEDLKFGVRNYAQASLDREGHLDYERRVLAAEIEWVELARQSLAFCEMMERNTSTLDCALIQANATATARKWDAFVVEPWMPALLLLKKAIQDNPLFPDHEELRARTASSTGEGL